MKPVFSPEGKEWGRFQPDCAGFTIKSLDVPTSWEYIYQNRDVLLKVDQFGPVYVQAHPPGDIMLFNRENGQKFSSWMVWLTSDEFSEPFTNFFRPLVNGKNPSKEPENLEISFRPECASYSFQNEGLRLCTEFIIPAHGTEIAMKFKVKNVGDKAKKFSVHPSLVPYVNPAQMAPWDKFEWYLQTGYGKNEQNVFWSQLLDANSDASKRRTAVFWTDAEGASGVELSLEKFVGNGDLSCPETVMTGNYRLPGDSGYDFAQYGENNMLIAYPPVYATKYDWTLNPGEEKELTQVLSMPQNDENGWFPSLADAQKTLCYFDNTQYAAKKAEAKAYFDALCSKNAVHTGDEDFDYYANYWIPLQMDWVASLDRGWPTGMRGSRDSAQDYAALLFTDQKSCKEVMLTMLECQRSDGWFPRQYSAKGRKGNHDLRGHVDGGAFAVEFFYNYFAHTNDYAILDEKLPWLDSDEESTVFEHMVRAMEYYILPENIGEHGICKIREGDWLDSVNRAGVKGRGESVTVSCQTVMNLQLMADIYEKTGRNLDKVDAYRKKSEQLKENILKCALNDKGFFNGTFTDNGQWIFSDHDPDGECRPYGPVNWYAVITGVAKERQKETVSVMEQLKSEFGYRLYWPPMGKVKMENVGRAASGDAPICFAENGNVYNHGSQGFLARALSVAGEGDKLFDVLKWLTPYDQSKHPTALAMTAPYAIVNCWQQIPVFRHRGLMCFLTGSVAMAMRGVYEWMMGVKPTLDGLELCPCLPESFEAPEVKFTYLGKDVTLRYLRTPGKVLLNGAPVENTVLDRFSGRENVLIAPELLKDGKNVIEYHLG